MRTLHRISIPAMGAAIAVAGLFAIAPTASASGAGPTWSYLSPSDCTMTLGPPYETVQMTCTGRPATQQWQLFANCTYGMKINSPDVDVYGNIVTGDGTSTLLCPRSTFYVNAEFEQVS
jgi:hypothetical protein